jgi:hypothetical protein
MTRPIDPNRAISLESRGDPGPGAGLRSPGGRPPDRTIDPGVPLPGNYAAQVMRRAVLVPLRGKLANRAMIERAADSVRASWRARITALAGLGWAPAAGAAASTLVHCRRPFTLPDTGTRCCSRRTICPHCWARHVLGVWTRIDSTLFPAGGRAAGPAARHAPREDLVLFERTVEYRIPFSGWIAGHPPEVRALRHWLRVRLQPGLLKTSNGGLLNRPAELRRLGALGCSGILDVTRALLDHGDDRKADPVGWRVQVRQVFTVPRVAADSVADNWRIGGEPIAMGGVPGTLTLTRHDRPGRRLVMTAVARAMAYPRMLLHGPPALALEVLKSRGTFRMIATTGAFRGGPGRPEG